MMFAVTPQPPEEAGERLWTTDDLAAYLRMSVGALHTLRHRGQGPKGVRVGKRVLYRPEDVQTFLQQRAEQ
jgi:hypothetical protein